MDTEFVLLILIFVTLFTVPWLRLLYGRYCYVGDDKVKPASDEKGKEPGKG